MNIRSLYRISWALESMLKDVVDGDLNDETEVLEVLIDAKRVCDMLSQELGIYINHKIGR